MKNFIYPARIPEWVASLGMLLACMQLFIETANGYTLFTTLEIPKIYVAIAIGVIGLLRMLALYINGRWRRTPAIRAVGAVLGALLFSLLSAGYLFALALAVSDIYAAYKAGSDARSVKL